MSSRFSRTLQQLEDIEDFVHGLVLFGSGGGGGRASLAIDQLKTVRDSGQTIGWVDIAELSDETWSLSVGGVGGKTPVEGPDARVLRQYGLNSVAFADSLEMQVAVARQLAALEGVEPGAIIPVELGSGNTVTPMLAAVELGIPLVNGDYCGRAKPEIQQSILEIEGQGPCPLVYIDHWGDVVHITEAASTAMVDRIGRHLCIAAQGGIACARNLLRVAEARHSIVQGSLETAFQAGRTLRDARRNGSDVVAAIVDHLTGVRLFDGVVERTDEDPSSGYEFRRCTHHVRGKGQGAAHTCAIWVKNEHHIVWVDDEPRAMSPDVIAVLEQPSGRPLTNGEIGVGQEVSVIAAPPLDPRWRTEKGIELLGPRAFDFEFDYQPVEAMV